MKEDEWLACEDPEKMLAWVEPRSSPRKQRYYFCECCRGIKRYISDKQNQLFISYAEAYAEGCLTFDMICAVLASPKDANKEQPTINTAKELLAYISSLNRREDQDAFWTHSAARSMLAIYESGHDLNVL